MLFLGIHKALLLVLPSFSSTCFPLQVPDSVAQQGLDWLLREN
jgi:hypothetical protein